MTKISVVGLGKLGACMAACFAHKGFSVIGVDVNPRTVQFVNEGRPPVFEPGLAEMMAEVRKRLWATGDYKEVIYKTDVTSLIQR